MAVMQPSREIAILGPGRVGTAVGVLAHQAGWRIVSIGARNSEAASQATSRISTQTRPCGLAEAAGSCTFVLLTVSDDAIETVCRQLVEASALKRGAVIAHCSGALPSGILAPARDVCGCAIASIHPLQTFPTVEAATQSLPGTSWFWELYHVAAVLACNYLTALMETSLTAAEAASIERDAFWPAVFPLIRATLENIGNLGTVKALTGPIARGDVATISRHLEAIARHQPSLTEVYKSLGKWTVGLSTSKGSAKTSSLKKIQALLQEGSSTTGKDAVSE